METLPCPQFKDSKNYAIQQGAGMAVMKTTKTRQQAAVEFLKWLTDAKQNVQFSKETGYLPVKKEANKVEPLVDNNDNKDTQKVVEVSIDTVKENTMYSPKAFKQGTKAGYYLQSMMSDKATEDRQVVETNLKNGQDLDQATASFTSDEYFEHWYQETKMQLQTYED
jgi:multiple sugar transport system substrate-binding protein